MARSAAAIKAWFKTSVWVFPIALLLLLLLLTALKINGSSIGVYHKFFYGDSQKDTNLIFGTPRPIRSDEWLVNTQKSLSQDQENYTRVNPDFGQGEDASVILDAPYRGWSSIFKPHNWSFFVLPFDYALAFKWWSMGYLLIVSCYFFTLALLPKKRLMAAALAVGVFFSPFVQWWYQYATLAPLYYSFFIALIFIKFLKENKLRNLTLLGLGLTYVLTAFALILYPPFQVACGLVLAVFLLGYLLENRRLITKKLLKTNGLVALTAITTSALIVVAFLHTRPQVISAIQNTVYPGQREASGGDYDAAHLFSSHLSTNFEFTKRAANYQAGEGVLATTNQSESSNFILLIPFLVLPGIFLLYRGYKKSKKIDWPLLLTTGFFGVLLIRILTPYMQDFFSLILLDRVPTKRLIIGFGFLGVIYLVLFIRNLSQQKQHTIPNTVTAGYTIAVFAVEILLGVLAIHRSPGFIEPWLVVLLSIPIPVIIYLLLKKQFMWAVLGFMLFSMLSSAGVNPLYRGTDVITDSSLSKAMSEVSENNNEGRWISENVYFENLAAVNGLPSLSGVYAYPQFDVWDDIENSSSDTYNRYAHTNVLLDRDPSVEVPTSLTLVAPDSFVVKAEPCNEFFKQWSVAYLVTTQPLSEQDSCAKLEKQLSYPNIQVFIYSLQ